MESLKSEKLPRLSLSLSLGHVQIFSVLLGLLCRAFSLDSRSSISLSLSRSLAFTALVPRGTLDEAESSAFD